MDPNIPPPPPGFVLDSSPAAPAFGGRPVITEGPKTPTPQTPEQRTATVVGTQQTRTQIANTGFDNVNNLRKQFETEQSVQDYKTVLPLMDNAFKLGPNKAGDLNLVYAFGKAMDPNSVVREGEQVMATNVGGISEKVRGYLDQINGGAGLTPVQRTELTEEIRNRARSLQQTYNQRRSFYEDFAKRSGINPGDVVGPHPGEPFIGDEKSYIEAHGGTPKSSGVAAPTQNEGHFGDERGDAPLPPHSDEFRNGLYSAMRSGKIKSPADMTAWTDGFNAAHGSNFHPQISAKDTARAIEAAKRGQPFNVEQPKYSPDISQVRDGNGFGERLDAGVRGAADTVSLGLADKVAAAGDTLTQPNTTFDENLARQYAISDYDTQNHFPSRLVGQIGGGLVLPMGEMSSIPQIALKSGAAGAAYGAGSSRSLSDVPLNALTGFAGGATLGGAVGVAGKGLAALRGRGADVPPLVDPVSGRLNEPLEAAGPAARVDAAQQFGVDLPMGSAGDRTAAIIERKLDVRPASAGIMNDNRRVVEGQVQNAVEDVAGKFGSARTLNEGGGEVQRGLNEWMGRADKVDAKVYNAIPISSKAPTTNNSTVGFLQQNTSKFESNPALQEELKDPKLAKYLVAIQQHGLNWQDLKDFRSYVGAKAGQFRFSQDPLKEDYRGLYGALSEDMRASAAAQGPNALRAFERANSFHAAMETRIEGAITQLLGNDANAAPEKAAAAIQTMTRGGKGSGDLAKLAQVRASTVKSGAWDEIAGTLIRIGGQPANSPGRGFDPGTFVRWYSDMAEPARGMLFRPELRKSLDQFVMVNQRLANSNALRNTSNTAMASPTGTFSIPTAGAALFTGHPMVAGGILAATAAKTATEYGLATLWTKPAFVQWATGYSRAAASGNANAVKSQLGRLGKLAVTNPELREPLIKLQQKLLSGANDNLTPSIAASQPDNGNEGEYDR